MEVSLDPLNLVKYLSEIEDHFREEYPKEACSILHIKKGKLLWTPCTNVAKDDEEFIMDSSEYLKLRVTSDIVGIIHNHPDGDSTPSEHDINTCNALGIPYYIFGYPEMDLTVVTPSTNTVELLGREYEFGVRDCFEALRDWYLSNGIEIPRRAAFEDDWWKKGLDYFNEETISHWGFEKVNSPKPGDALIFSVDSTVGNHCGVYLGNDMFFHHAQQRLSCRENLYPFWIKSLTGIYRNVT